MSEDHHNVSVTFVGAGARARCLARNCNWTSPVHRAWESRGLALAWQKAKDDGRAHTSDEQRRR